ncbi:MAG: hypothetical protein ACE366_11960 [Bradymonadia bacterium]
MPRASSLLILACSLFTTSLSGCFSSSSRRGEFCHPIAFLPPGGFDAWGCPRQPPLLLNGGGVTARGADTLLAQPGLTGWPGSLKAIMMLGERSFPESRRFWAFRMTAPDVMMNLSMIHRDPHTPEALRDAVVTEFVHMTESDYWVGISEASSMLFAITHIQSDSITRDSAMNDSDERRSAAAWYLALTGAPEARARLEAMQQNDYDGLGPIAASVVDRAVEVMDSALE